jgi:hypothetical protein
MRVPGSPFFIPIVLNGQFNADRSTIDGGLAPSRRDWSPGAFGETTISGIPFLLGHAGEPNLILVDRDEIRIETGSFRARYLVFLHAVEDRPAQERIDFGEYPEVRNGTATGNDLGDHVADYVLSYDDGAEAVTPIYRRFAIQQRHIGWGASPFAAMPAAPSEPFSSATEDYFLNRIARVPYGDSETRHSSGREGGDNENLWLYALPNPFPEKTIHSIIIRPGGERAVIYGLSATEVEEHPIRPGVRRKLRLRLPEGAHLNRIGELDVDSRGRQIALDLGVVISARAALDYDPKRWTGAEPDVQPSASSASVVVEYAAHPKAKLYVATGPESSISFDLPELEAIPPADRPVTIRVIDKATRQPVAVRLHLHGQGGEYLPPRGYHRKVNPYWFEDNYGEFVNGRNNYCYMPGECVADLPLGTIWVEIARGYEVAPIRTSVEIGSETNELVFELEKTLDWRERGWVTADTHVHFLSPQTALLEGQAEGVNVVNLLTSQWGEMFSNVSDFDGRTTIGAKEFGGDGEFLVRVGTENRMQVLGHISLLGYDGAMITPLCTGGPSESAIGDPLEVSMAEWAERCIAQNGLVVMPHAPNPQCERAADIVLDLVHAVEMMTFNPHEQQISPFALADWYRFQNIGHQVPVCGGSDKMSAASQLGGIRTYAHLGDNPFGFDTWKDAVKAGNTFVTVGPLIEFSVEGKPAGRKVNLPAGGGTVEVDWRVESVQVPIDEVEIVMGGLVAASSQTGGTLSAAGTASIPVTESTWIALRVRGSVRGRHGDIAAHTSTVQAIVGDRPLWVEADAIAVLEQIEGALAYVDTLAPRPEAQRLKQLRATLERAHRKMHARLHHQEVLHKHTTLHSHDSPREH